MQNFISFLAAAIIVVAPAAFPSSTRASKDTLTFQAAASVATPSVNSQLLDKYVHKISIEKDGKILGSGSGVIISRNRILTAQHVVGAEGTKLWLLLPNGIRKRCTVIRADKTMDIALLACEHGVRGPYLSIRNSMNTMGEEMSVCGFEYGTTKIIRQGNVEARLSRHPYHLTSPIRYNHFEIDALVSPGMSGGAALDSRGRLAGIIIEVRRDNGNSILVSSAGINQFMINP